MTKKNKKTSKKNSQAEIEENMSAQANANNESSRDIENEEATLDEQDVSNEELLQKKVDELNDKYLRLYSEYDNYRKRTLKEKIDLVKTASSEVITDLLPVIDDMGRAIKSAEESDNCTALKEGFILINNKMQSILEKKGLKPIEAVGEPFDTDYHEAITFIPAPSDDMKGKVLEEVEKGYTLNEKVIRFTKAVIGQ